MRNKQWDRWNPKIREGLIGSRLKTTCAKESWDPFSPVPDIWAELAGRLYLTSLSILTLEVYYRSVPLYRAADDDQRRWIPSSRPTMVRARPARSGGQEERSEAG